MEAVIFDMDDVLINSEPISKARAFTKLGISFQKTCTKEY